MPAISELAKYAHALPPTVTKVRVGRVLSFVLAKLGVATVVPVVLNDGTTMLLDARGRTEGGAVWNGSFDDGAVAILKACLPAGGCLLDVGANVGLIAVPVARWLEASGGHVIAVEPVRTNCKRLAVSAALNGLNMHVFEVALGDAEGTIEMHRDAGLGASSGNAIMGDAGSAIYTQVTVARLTTFKALRETEHIGSVDVVKIDIEGAELLFIRGALDLFALDRVVAFGEFNSNLMPLFGHSFLDVDAVLGPLGYRYAAFEASNRPVEVQARVGLGNVLLVPGERFDEIIEGLRSHPAA